MKKKLQAIKYQSLSLYRQRDNTNQTNQTKQNDNHYKRIYKLLCNHPQIQSIYRNT